MSISSHAPNYWWLGFNNRIERDRSSRAVVFGEIRSFLWGSVDTFEWPQRGNVRRHYSEIADGDRAVLWMGHEKTGMADWGVWGFVTISRATSTAPILLRDDGIFPLPASPYTQFAPRGAQSRTRDSELLLQTFGLNFEPLFDVYSWLGYMKARRMITVYPVGRQQYEKLRDALSAEAA